MVCEDTCTRLRYFYGVAPETDDPLSDLSERYVERKAPSPCMVGFDKRMRYILNLINEFHVDAVVYYVLKFDDHYLFEFPDMKQLFEQYKIPVLRLETEHNTSAVNQIKTRLQAFIETLCIRKPKPIMA